MLKENKNNSSGGVSFAGLLTVLFVGLKLTNYIDWSWWWVLSPLWISLVLVIVVILITIIIVGIKTWIEFIQLLKNKK